MENEIDKVVIYAVNGRPLTGKDVQKEIAEAEEDYKKGNYFTQEKLMETIENWRK